MGGYGTPTNRTTTAKGQLAVGGARLLRLHARDFERVVGSADAVIKRRAAQYAAVHTVDLASGSGLESLPSLKQLLSA